MGKQIGTDEDAATYGKQLERLLRSRKPGRDDRVIRAEMLELIAEIDEKFERPGIVQVVAAEKLARSYVRTKEHGEACRVERAAVEDMRALGRVNETLYFERLTSLAEKLIKLDRRSEAEQLFGEEVPRTKFWPSANLHELHAFLRTQAVYLQDVGRYEEAAVAFSRVAEVGVAAFGDSHSQYYPIMRGYVGALLLAGRVAEACTVLEDAISKGMRTGSMDDALADYAKEELEQIRALL